MDMNQVLAAELNVKPWQVEAAVKLIDEGNTIPFISRYRKEATGSLNDEILRNLYDRLMYLRSLNDRKAVVLASIEEQGKLTAELKKSIEEAATLVVVEDLYRPYRPKRRTRATIAKEKGLEPLANIILLQMTKEPLEKEAEAFVSEEKEVKTAKDAIAGACDIIAESISDEADYRMEIRRRTEAKGLIVSTAKDEKAESVYENYYEFSEPVSKIAGHRVLALNRGEKEKFLNVKIEAPTEEILRYLEKKIITKENPQTKPVLQATIEDAYNRLIAPAIEREVRNQLTEKAEDGAIKVFGKNLEQLLMQPPIAGQVVLGWDPAFRTGCKLAVVDATGKVLDTTVVYPTAPTNEKKIAAAKATVKDLIHKYGVTLISVGNGTASRESEQIIVEILKEIPEKVAYVITNEAGASVYSASKLATEEFPNFDVGQRSAASIARRVQDPLAELVKIDPKSIGVGQYQHDVDQGDLARKLDAVVEDCVNSVGVNLNTASPMLLRRVAGLTSSLAEAVVRWREAHGAFASRAQLLSVPRLGQKTFEQAAGFLRIQNGENPLDASAVHPEAYSVANAIAEKTGLPIEKLIGNESVLKRLRPADFVTDQFGLPTVKDILSELEKPGRDPRPEFVMAHFLEGVTEISDLKPGMKLEGVVSNVTAFGAFVDIGVHQDGLVHISELADHYVNDPSAEVRVGQIVKVRVLDVDEKRKRIALSMRREGAPRSEPRAGRQSAPRMKSERTGGGFSGAMAAAFQNASGNPRRK